MDDAQWVEVSLDENTVVIYIPELTPSEAGGEISAVVHVGLSFVKQ
jgi:hypothetical protein